MNERGAATFIVFKSYKPGTIVGKVLSAEAKVFADLLGGAYMLRFHLEYALSRAVPMML